MKKIILFVIVALVFSSCVKSLEEEGISLCTTVRGCVVDRTSFDPIANITVQITNGAIVYAQTITRADGSWSLTIETDKIDQDYYLFLCESAEYNSLKGKLKGFGKTEFDYTNILMTSKYAELPTFSYGGQNYRISSDMGVMDWNKALSTCASLSERGHTDWYLPTIEEAIFMYRKLNNSSSYWSSTEYSATSAYYVHNFNQSYSTKTSKISVRCVRREN